MEPRKQAIMAALDRFVAQRPGLEFGNYGDVKAYRAEMRSITRDRHDYNALARAVERSDSITADMLIKASESAFSGRLTICEGPGPDRNYVRRNGDVRIDYVTGQYFPTEYRKAACAVLASALWEHYLENHMPAPCGYTVREWGNRHTQWGPFPTRTDADAELIRLTRQHSHNGESWGTVDAQYARGAHALSAGDWLRAYFRREFGRGIANRWFS